MLNKIEMFKCGVHFGHKTRYWNPKTADFVYGKHPDLDLHIINLDRTATAFEAALLFIQKIVQAKGKVLFVGTKRNAQEMTKTFASAVGMPYVYSRWLGGMLTNFKTIKRSIEALRRLEAQVEEQAFSGYTKKERLTLERRLHKLQVNLGGIKDMTALPDAIFVLDVNHERIAVKEANKLGIPVIGVVDTNASPEGIDYPIPGNDDAVLAIHYYYRNVVSIIETAKERLAELSKDREEEKPQGPTIVRQAGKADVKAEEASVDTQAADEQESEADAKPAKKRVVRRKTAQAEEETAEKKVVRRVAKSSKTTDQPLTTDPKGE